MTEHDERFIKKEYPWDWWFIFDKKQEYTEDTNKIPFSDVDNLIAMSEDQVTDLLNKLYKENQELRKDNNHLVKKTAEVIAEHQGQILTIIDEALDKVKQDTKKNYSRYDVIQILTHIKKEQNER